jgi:hypothetical protein
MGKFAINVLRVSSIAIALLTLSSRALTYKAMPFCRYIRSIVFGLQHGVHFGSAAYAKPQYDTTKIWGTRGVCHCLVLKF